jgi:hypothetical protein
MKEDYLHLDENTGAYAFSSGQALKRRFWLKVHFILNLAMIHSTYDHRSRNTGHPVRTTYLSLTTRERHRPRADDWLEMAQVGRGGRG